MKKTVLCTAGILALAVLAYIGGRSGAQGTATAPAAGAAASGTTRVAIMNLAYVIKNYEKFKAFELEMKSNFKDFEDRMNGKRNQYEAMRKEAETTTAPANKEELEKKLKVLQREVEDLKAEAQAYINKKRDERIVQFYREVQDAAQRYALSQGIDLVLHYTDATTQQEYYNPANVARKMQSPGAIPLYYSQASDISQQVVMSLNAAYRPATAPPANGTTPSSN